jgi:hypothetical protein
MNTQDRYRYLRSILWDYSIPVEDIDAVLSGRKKTAGHYSREGLLVKMFESYPWFTLLKFFSPADIKIILTPDLIKKLRSPSLRLKYGFIQKRLREIIPDAG